MTGPSINPVTKDPPIASVQQPVQRTVIFNVSGTIYEVSDTLLGRHPETMLARIGSCVSRVPPLLPIHIGRDAGRFRYVLDYMRDGRVVLPLFQPGAPPKESILYELDYYGFIDVDASSISVEQTTVRTARCLVDMKETFDREIGELDHKVESCEAQIGYKTMAYHCSNHFVRTGETEFKFDDRTDPTEDIRAEFRRAEQAILKSLRGVSIDENHMSTLNADHMSRYGLYVTKMRFRRYDDDLESVLVHLSRC